MSNLRIKNKKLKRELELLKYNTVPCKGVYAHHQVVNLRSSLMLTEEDMDYISKCIQQVKWMLCEEVEDYIKVRQVQPDLNNPGLHFPILTAELSVLSKEK